MPRTVPTKRVLAIVYTYIPDDPRVSAQARTAVEGGYAVDGMGIALYNGHSGIQTQDGVHVTTVPVVHQLSQVAPNLAYVLRGRVPERPVAPEAPLPSNALSLLFFYLWVLRLGLFRRYDLIHAHEHQAMPVAAVLATLKGCAWVYDAHEHVPGNRRTFTTRKARLAVRTEAALLRRASAVITVGERLARDLRERGAQSTVIIGNWKARDRFEVTEAQLAEKRAAYGLDSFRLVVAYFGVLNEERQVDVLLDAMPHAPDVALLLAGRGDLRERAVACAQEQSNIIWLDWLNLEDVPLHTMLADVVYACLKEVSGNPEYMAPNKLFDAFVAGKALIARRGLGEIGAILETVPAAVLLDEVTRQSLLDAFDRLKDPAVLGDLQANAREAAEVYNWDVARERLYALYAD